MGKVSKSFLTRSSVNFHVGLVALPHKFCQGIRGFRIRPFSFWNLSNLLNLSNLVGKSLISPPTEIAIGVRSYCSVINLILAIGIVGKVDYIQKQ